MLLRPFNLALATLTFLLLGQTFAKAEGAPLVAVMRAVFSVHSADSEDRFMGSAFLWSQSGEVAVTNAHVVGEETEVRLIDAAGHEEIALVIGVDPVRDVAVIAVKPGRQGLVAAGTPPALGDEVWALGAPLGIEFSVTNGRVSALARQVDANAPIRLLQHDAALNPGSSGGPLVDASGGLLGMNSQIADGSRMFVGISYAIGVSDLQRIVTGLIDETLPQVPALGLKLRAVDRQLAAVLGCAATGLLVDEVETGGLAAKAGLRAGDILLALGGKKLNAAGDLAFAVEAAQAAGSADLAVQRQGALILIPFSVGVDQDQGQLALRDLSGAEPTRVGHYTLAQLGLTLDAAGLVGDVTQNSPALFAGVAVGDRVAQINGQTVDPATLGAFVAKGAILLLLQNPQGSRHVLVDPYADTGGFRPVGGANVLDPDVVVF